MIKHYRILKGFADSSVEFLQVSLSGHEYPVHYHKRHCAGEIESGSMSLAIHGETLELNEGSFFYVPAFTGHSVVMKKREVSYTAVNYSDVHDLNRFKERVEIWREIENVHMGPLVEYACSVSLNEDKRLKDSIGLVVRYIQDNYMDVLTVEDLSQVAGLSASRLQHVFKEAMGLPLKQFIIQEKIRKSREMLPEKSIINTALDCGFYDQSHFIRNFKKQTGLTPSQYSQSIELF